MTERSLGTLCLDCLAANLDKKLQRLFWVLDLSLLLIFIR